MVFKAKEIKDEKVLRARAKRGIEEGPKFNSEITVNKKGIDVAEELTTVQKLKEVRRVNSDGQEVVEEFYRQDSFTTLSLSKDEQKWDHDLMKNVLSTQTIHYSTTSVFHSGYWTTAVRVYSADAKWEKFDEQVSWNSAYNQIHIAGTGYYSNGDYYGAVYEGNKNSIGIPHHNTIYTVDSPTDLYVVPTEINARSFIELYAQGDNWQLDHVFYGW